MIHGIYRLKGVIWKRTCDAFASEGANEKKIGKDASFQAQWWYVEFKVYFSPFIHVVNRKRWLIRPERHAQT